VLDDISINFDSGKIYGLRGKNGSGKTMLMRAICGLIIPTSGEIIIDGEVLHKDIAFPRSIGALIENPSFLPNCSGFNNLSLLNKLNNKATDDEIVQVLSDVALDPYDKKPYRKYSLGMKQKLGIANAILGAPDVIILDEPINALDVETVEVIKKLLIGLKNADKTIIVACHDKEELEYLSDIIYEIKEGKIV
jgi:ABC-2 type transport system ATP-binding protein